MACKIHSESQTAKNCFKEKMINALYESFPESVIADGTEYPIITDFREWFRFADMIEDKQLDDSEKILLITNWLLEPPLRITNELVNAVFGFYRAKALEPEPPENEDETDDKPPPSPPVINWKIDAQYIIGDFLHCYGIDLLREDMHWWKFRILLNSLPDNSQMMKRMAYRSADIGQIQNEAERNRIMRMKQLFALPFELDDEAIRAVLGGTM